MSEPPSSNTVANQALLMLLSAAEEGKSLRRTSTPRTLGARVQARLYGPRNAASPGSPTTSEEGMSSPDTHMGFLGLPSYGGQPASYGSLSSVSSRGFLLPSGLSSEDSSPTASPVTIVREGRTSALPPFSMTANFTQKKSRFDSRPSSNRSLLSDLFAPDSSQRAQDVAGEERSIFDGRPDSSDAGQSLAERISKIKTHALDGEDEMAAGAGRHQFRRKPFNKVKSKYGITQEAPRQPKTSDASVQTELKLDHHDWQPEIHAMVDTEGGPWDRTLLHDPSTLSIFIDNSGLPNTLSFGVVPNSLLPTVVRAIGIPLRRYLAEQSSKELPNSHLCPSASNDTFDWGGKPRSFRSPEDEAKIVRWIMHLHAIIRLIHCRIREKFPALSAEFGMERLRVCWAPPAFNDPMEEGEWVPEFWFPLKGPYLSIRETVQTDTVPIADTRIHQLLRAHFPEVVEDLSPYEIPDGL
ncbi:hypothetical protein BJ508DRAFT_418402 [Ascobolus immersus RN42]|uniref:Uncharacterized protein n=1 Tax=Ascobolus immersus RN42 TaxID=1160509 RepID=A0A3N4HYQ8_ASCIM|nr:hypothetical protein BJ508DRAFT_418402 [Ascobolus immersus RN42]